MLRLLALLALLLLPMGTAVAQDTLAGKLNVLLDGPDYAHGRWGILVVDAETGKSVFERNPDTFCAPASVTKLFSCSAAMIAFGADHRFVTPVHQRGELTKDGTLKGDLILVAHGDLTFGGRRGKDGKTLFENNDHSYADGLTTDAVLTDSDPLFALKDLAKQVRAAGIKRVMGEILVDARLFAPARGSGSGPAAVSPMLVNDNVIDLLIEPGAKVGDPAKITVRPPTAYLRPDMVVVTGTKESKAEFDEPNDDPSGYVLRGSIPLGSKPIVSLIPVNRPVEFARTLFVECLRAEGIRVEAVLVSDPPEAALPEKAKGYEKLSAIAKYTSEPLHEQLRVTLKVSHNLYASTLPCLVGAKAGKPTLKGGLMEQGKILKTLGVDMKSASFGGGAGGSVADHVTARATVQLLQALRQRDEWSTFRNCLPQIGVDGTLATILPKTSPAHGKVFAKTGTLYWTDFLNDSNYLTSKALAGTMTTKSGKEYVLAIFVNDVQLPKGVKSRREGLVLGKLCEILYGE